MPDISQIQTEWLVVSGAPWLFLTAIVTVAGAIWALIWLIYRGEIKQKNARIETLIERLNLAADSAAVAHQVEDDFGKKIQTLETAIAAKADNESLIKLSAEVKEGFSKLTTANSAVSSTLSATLNVTEVPDVASFTINTAQLDAIRDLDGWGALRKVDPETRERIKDLGKPFPGISTKKK